MSSNDKLARCAGLLYLILLPTTGLAYGSARLLMAGDTFAGTVRPGLSEYALCPHRWHLAASPV
jgi:hypothetical protein